jgi:NAD(P)-dependent dehydrogenase (short-subunit alcohol dehydrogenase family)
VRDYAKRCPNGMTRTASSFARRHFLRNALTSAVGLVSSVSVFRTTRATAPRSAVACPNVPTPMQDVSGKVAFITGGSSGIGLGIAQTCAQAGMKVVIGYRSKEHLDEALKSLGDLRDRIHAVSVDVTDRGAMERAAADTVKTFGKVHVLVANAGVVAMASVSQSTYDDWDWVIGVNLTGVFNSVHAFLPHIQGNGEGGQIIAASSAGGLITAGGAGGAYTASKFAVVGMMEGLRAELAEHNIGVSVYCPGTVTSNLPESERNRPSRLPDVGVKLDDRAKASFMEQLRDPQLAITPLEMGRLVLRGMRNNDLYILTHPEYEPFVRARGEALLASFPTDIHPTQARVEHASALLQKSVYITERDRRLCSARLERS